MDCPQVAPASPPETAEEVRKCPRLDLGIVTIVATKQGGSHREDATGLSGGISRSVLVTRHATATNVTIHRTSRWHSVRGVAAVCSGERNIPPGKPVALSSNGATSSAVSSGFGLDEEVVSSAVVGEWVIRASYHISLVSALG